MTTIGLCPYSFSDLAANYPKYPDAGGPKTRALYQKWGVEDQARQWNSGNVGNSCAVRMSLCLLKCGMRLGWDSRKGSYQITSTPPGKSHLDENRLPIRVGRPLSNRGLTDVLHDQWGPPAEYGSRERGKWNAAAKQRTRLDDVAMSSALVGWTGVIAYFGLIFTDADDPDEGHAYPGHIGIVKVDSSGRVDSGGSHNYLDRCDYAHLWPCNPVAHPS